MLFMEAYWLLDFDLMIGMESGEVATTFDFALRQVPPSVIQYKLKHTEQVWQSSMYRHKYELPTAQILSFVYSTHRKKISPRKYPDAYT